jgi:hypothetical protein
MLKMPGVKLKLNSKTNFEVSKTTLLSNKLLLVGSKTFEVFPCYWKLLWHSEEEQFVQGYVCTLKFSDGAWEEITFDDAIVTVMKLIPKSWWQKRSRTSVLSCRVLLPVRDKGDSLWCFRSQY